MSSPPPPCEAALASALAQPFVRFVLQAMDELGCDTSVDGGKFSARCAPCLASGAEGASEVGRFEAGEKRVTLCGDVIERYGLPREHVERTVLHELIHAYDHCRARMDPDNCEHVACTEVRAANLSGDCDLKNELQRRNFAVKGQGALCARRRAELSVAANPKCKDRAKEAVDKVFDACYGDTSPFLGKF